VRRTPLGPLPLLFMNLRHICLRQKKWAPRAHFAKPVKCGVERIAPGPPPPGPAMVWASSSGKHRCGMGRHRSATAGVAIAVGAGVVAATVAPRLSAPTAPEAATV